MRQDRSQSDAVIPFPRLQLSLIAPQSTPAEDGGLCVINDRGDHACFDASLHRVDPLNVFERLQRIVIDNFRLYVGDSSPGINGIYSQSLMPLKQAAMPALLLGLPVLILITKRHPMWQGELPDTPFLESSSLLRAAQLYIALFAVFISWFWTLTLYF